MFQDNYEYMKIKERSFSHQTT